MFGTLVLVLPSHFEGGELVVRHGGKEASLNLQNDEASTIRFAAFFADCEHEVKPVTKGFRVCLIYNLINEGRKSRKFFSPPNLEKHVSSLSKLLPEFAKPSEKHFWSFDRPPEKLVWLLEHQYTKAELDIENLKGPDRGKAVVLKEAGEKLGWYFSLALVTITETGMAEYTAISMRPCMVSESDKKIEHFTEPGIPEVEEGLKVKIEDQELLPYHALKEERPDKQKFQEQTGNEGPSFERIYRRAAIVLWPKTGHVGFLLKGSLESAIAFLRRNIKGPLPSCPGETPEEKVMNLAKRILAYYEHEGPRKNRYEAQKPTFPSMYQALLELGDRDLLVNFLKNIVSRHFGGSGVEMGRALPLIGWENLQAVLSVTYKKEQFKLFRDGMALLENLQQVRISRKEQKEAEKTIHGLASSLIRCLDDSPSFSKEPKKGIYFGREVNQPHKLEPKEVVRLLLLYSEVPDPSLPQDLVEKILSLPDAYPMSSFIIPLAKEVSEEVASKKLDPKIFQELFLAAGNLLVEKTKTPPSKEENWSQKIELLCHCPACQELEAFAKSKTEREGRFKMDKRKRKHLMRMVEKVGAAMEKEMEGEGRKEVLVCRKTSSRSQRLWETFRLDCDAVRELLAASSSVKPLSSAVRQLKARLEENLAKVVD